MSIAVYRLADDFDSVVTCSLPIFPDEPPPCPLVISDTSRDKPKILRFDVGQGSIQLR